jgi:hypothetical protein
MQHQGSLGAPVVNNSICCLDVALYIDADLTSKACTKGRWRLEPVRICAFSAGDDCEDLLAALVQRARAYKTEVEKLHDKAAAAAATGVQQAAAAVGEPQINWQSMPWR